MRASQPGQSPLLLLDIIETLRRYEISYVVVGAMAVSFYGLVRASLDADAVISIAHQPQALRDLQAALTARGLKVVVKKGDIEDPLDGVVFIADDHGNQVDLLLGIKGMDRDIFDRAVETTLEGTTLRMVSVEDLIAMKVFAGGYKDLEDVKGVLSVSAEKIDMELTRRLTTRYGRQALQRLTALLNA